MSCNVNGNLAVLACRRSQDTHWAWKPSQIVYSSPMKLFDELRGHAASPRCSLVNVQPVRAAEETQLHSLSIFCSEALLRPLPIFLSERLRPLQKTYWRRPLWILLRVSFDNKQHGHWGAVIRRNGAIWVDSTGSVGYLWLKSVGSARGNG